MGSARHRAREADSKAARRGGKLARNAKKILNRGNEPKDVLQTQDLAFFGAQNEPNFECKNEPIEAKKRVLAPGFYVAGGGG